MASSEMNNHISEAYSIIQGRLAAQQQLSAAFRWAQDNGFEPIDCTSTSFRVTWEEGGIEVVAMVAQAMHDLGPYLDINISGNSVLWGAATIRVSDIALA